MSTHRRSLALALALALAFTTVSSIAACHRDDPVPPPSPSSPETARAPSPTPMPGEITNDPHALPMHALPFPSTGNNLGGPVGPRLAWTAPPVWPRGERTSQMRLAQYTIPRATGDMTDGELAVFTFGRQGGGNVQANLERWYSQVTLADGGASAPTAWRDTFQVNNQMIVTVTSVTGRLGGAQPAMPGMPAVPVLERGKLLAAIVQTENGSWFFKMTGPERTVTAAQPQFLAMLHSVHFEPIGDAGM